MNQRSLLLAVGFVAVFFAIDRGLGFGLSKIFERVETGQQVGLANYAVKQVDKEIVIFGSSRAVFHIDPDVLSEELGLSAFNAGSPAQKIRYARSLQSLLLRRGSRAKLFVLNVDPRTLWGVELVPLQRLAPFYGEDPAVDALLEANDPASPLKLQVETYRYNSLVVPMFANLLGNRASVGNGFRVMPAGREQNLEIEDYPADPGPIREDIRQLYADFIADARKHGVQVALIDGPRWRPDGPRPVDRIGHPILEELAREGGAAWIVIDEFTDPVFQDSKYFADVAHLTQEGAQIFSRRLAERLREAVRL